MKTPFSFFLLLLLLPAFSFATHIVGGTIMYRYLGGNSYEISLRIYRDCSNGSAAFPASALVEVRDVNGNNFTPTKTYTTAFDSAVAVPSYLPSCIPNPGLCYEEGFYTQIVNNMPPQPGGYHIYFQYCCRPATLMNVVNPLSAGMSLYAFIPDATTITANNSARWNLAPPLFECQGTPMNYDYGATDSDGDSLVFTYYTPYNDPVPTFPSGVATFTPITWVGGFGATNSCGGPLLTMSSQTGFVTGAPPNLGIYQHGVRCEEFRNGVKIAEIRRDYPFVVVNCPPAPLAAFFVPTTICFGSTLQYTNNSMNATSYFWDFGDPAVTNDTSTAANPSWLYANPGTYIVMLIADPNTGCADTTYHTITVQQVNAAFIANDTMFAGQTSQFTDSSWTSNGAAIVMWYWNFGDGNTSILQDPTNVYAVTGTYNVQLIVLSADGCMDTVVIPNVVVPPNGMEDMNALNPSVFPDPSDGTFTISFGNVSENVDIRISDMSGRLVYEQHNVLAKEILLKLNCESGMYFLEVNSNGRSVVQKIVVE